jgi:hypothetical protein
MKKNEPIEARLRTRQEIADIIGLGVRKLYEDIQNNEALKSKIRPRGLLFVEEQRLIFSFYGIPFPYT